MTPIKKVRAPIPSLLNCVPIQPVYLSVYFVLVYLLVDFVPVCVCSAGASLFVHEHVSCKADNECTACIPCFQSGTA